MYLYLLQPSESDDVVDDVIQPMNNLTVEEGANLASSSRSRTRLDADLLQILVPIFMQDGPFLVLRLVMILQFKVADEVHIYFTGKNALTLVLLLYRLYSLRTKETVVPNRGSVAASRAELRLMDVTKTIDDPADQEIITGNSVRHVPSNQSVSRDTDNV